MGYGYMGPESPRSTANSVETGHIEEKLTLNGVRNGDDTDGSGKRKRMLL